MPMVCEPRVDSLGDDSLAVTAPGRGLEPLFSEPKSAVLPLDDPGTTFVLCGPNDAPTVSERTCRWRWRSDLASVRSLSLERSSWVR